MGDSLRLFFALWPDEETRNALDRVAVHLQTNWRGRRVPREALHLTLVFLGDTPRIRIDDLCASAARVRSHSFTLTLNRVDCWSRQGIGWLGVLDPNPELMQLASHLRQALQRDGFSFDARRYQPHVTLLRNANCGESSSCKPVFWRVDSFALLASRAQPGYDILQTWPLHR